MHLDKLSEKGNQIQHGPVTSGGDPEPDLDPHDPLILGLPDPDPLFRGTDQDPAPDPSLERTEKMLENKILHKILAKKLNFFKTEDNVPVGKL
jgi:hypothetical protein